MLFRLSLPVLLYSTVSFISSSSVTPCSLLYPTVYSPAWREQWLVWSAKQIPQQASHFPVESPGLGGMLTLHYSTPPHTTMSSMNDTALSASPGISATALFLSPFQCLPYILGVPTSNPPSLSPHACAIDRIFGLLYELTWWHGVNRQIRVCFRPETVTL